MKRALHLLRKSEGLRSSALMITGNMVAQGMSGVAIILISRLLGPTEFGVFSSGFAIAMIVGSIVDAGMAAAQAQTIPQAETARTKNQLFATVVAIKTILFAFTIVMVAPFGGILSQRLNLDSQQVLFWLLIANVGSLFFNQLASMLTALRNIPGVVGINIAQAVSKLVLVAVLAMTALKNGEVTLYVYLLLPILILPFASRLLPSWYELSARFGLAQWQKLKPMAINSWIASIGSMLVQNADIIIVGMLLTPFEAGLIGSASRLAMFVALIGNSLTGVLSPRVAAYQSKEDLDAYWKKSLLVLLGSSALAVLSFFVSGLIMTLTSGAEYAAAAPALSWLLAASWLGVGIAPLTCLFFSYRKAWYFSMSSIVQGVIILSGLFLLLPTYGLVAAGWIRFAAQLVIIVLAVVVALRSHIHRFGTFPKL